MREIKFRVWDKDLKRMHICGGDIHDSISFINNQACYYNLQNGCGSSLPDDDDEGTYELMQSTGLKDKNGNLIFEGDILKDDETFLWEVEFESGCFYAKCSDLKASTHLYRLINYLNIIGNIHKNPELLEAKS